MNPIELSKKNQRLPEYGTPVRIIDKISPNNKCRGFFVKEKHIECRRSSENGTYHGWVPGGGGDIWWILHEDGTIGAYTIDEITDVEDIKLTPYLWDEAKRLLDMGERDRSSYLIYKTLYEETFEKKNYEICNEFLKFIIQEDINTYIITLILNVLSPKKEKLPYWDEFVEKCIKKLIEQKGEEYAKDLLKVIV